LQHLSGSQLGCADCVYRHKEAKRDRIVQAPGAAGCLVFLAGAATALLGVVGLNLKVLLWIDAWGADTGWLIRGALCASGIALLGVSVALGKVLPKPERPPGMAPPPIAD